MAKEIHHCLNEQLSSQSIYLGPLMILDEVFHGLKLMFPDGRGTPPKIK
jgi:hypothetical protein